MNGLEVQYQIYISTENIYKNKESIERRLWHNHLLFNVFAYDSCVLLYVIEIEWNIETLGPWEYPQKMLMEGIILLLRVYTCIRVCRYHTFYPLFGNDHIGSVYDTLSLQNVSVGVMALSASTIFVINGKNTTHTLRTPSVFKNLRCEPYIYMNLIPLSHGDVITSAIFE